MKKLLARVPNWNLFRGTNSRRLGLRQWSMSAIEALEDRALLAAFSVQQAAVQQVGGAATPLVAYGSNWKYLDNGTDQGTAWRAAGFNDAAWASGPSKLGYGDANNATTVGFGPSSTNKYVTTYFRQSFNIANPGSISTLDLGVVRDDGVAVYLNGVEIVRNNLAAGALFNTLARLERSFLEMSEYAAKVAHELRTPITILRHKVEQAQGKIDPDMAEDLQEELLRLNHVVEQSLLIAKAGQGRLAWRLEPVDLSSLVSELVKDFDLLATAQERRIQLHAEPERVVQTDAKYCKQILHALLTNALIHGRGDIRVRLVGRGQRVSFATVNEVRSTPTPSELTLGLGLRVVRALASQQLSLRFRQHHGSRYHASCLSFQQ